jgi:hypothetical protein
MKLNFTNAKNPKWANESNTLIDLIVRFKEIDEDLPFTANPNDVEEHGRDLFARAVVGEFGSIATYVAPQIITQPKPTKEQLLAQLAELSAKINALGA